MSRKDHIGRKEAARIAQECNTRNAVYWGNRDPQCHIEREAARRNGEQNFIPKRNGIRVDVLQAFRRHQAKKKSTQRGGNRN